MFRPETLTVSELTIGRRNAGRKGTATNPPRPLYNYKQQLITRQNRLQIRTIPRKTRTPLQLEPQSRRHADVVVAVGSPRRLPALPRRRARARAEPLEEPLHVEFPRRHGRVHDEQE